MCVDVPTPACVDLKYTQEYMHLQFYPLKSSMLMGTDVYRRHSASMMVYVRIPARVCACVFNRFVVTVDVEFQETAYHQLVKRMWELASFSVSERSVVSVTILRKHLRILYDQSELSIQPGTPVFVCGLLGFLNFRGTRFGIPAVLPRYVSTNKIKRWGL